MSTRQVRILQIAGPAGVGKTTLAWEISVQLRRAGVSHVVLDSDELDRVWPLSESERESLNRANLSTFWANASALGHSRLILVGVFLRRGADRNWIARALPHSAVTRMVLEASDVELERRLRTREIGSGFEDQLRRTLDQAHQFRDLRRGGDDVVITDGREVRDLAREVIERARWIDTGGEDPFGGAP
jgi:AAA domain